MYGSEADDYQNLANSEEFHVSEKLANADKGDKKTVLVDIDENVPVFQSFENGSLEPLVIVLAQSQHI